MSESKESKVKVVCFGDSFAESLTLFQVASIVTHIDKRLTAADAPTKLDAALEIAKAKYGLDAQYLFVFGGYDVQIKYFEDLIFTPESKMKFQARIDGTITAFVEWISRHKFTNAVVATCLMPAVSNPGNFYDSIINFSGNKYNKDRSEAIKKFVLSHVQVANHKLRVKMINDWNDRLALECAANGIKLIDINDGVAREDGTIAPRFRDVSQININIIWQPQIPLWCKRLALADSDIDQEKLDCEKKYKDDKLKRFIKGGHYYL